MIAIKVPPLGESIVEAVVSRWLKKEGDRVAPGDTLVELETDKVTVEVPTMTAGVLTKRAHAEGDTVKLDDLLAEIDDSATASASPEKPAEKPAEPATAAQAGKSPEQPGAPTRTTEPRAQHQAPEPAKVSPAAQRIADERGVDLAAVAGTGRGGVVSKPDVIAASTGAGSAAAATPAPTDVGQRTATRATPAPERPQAVPHPAARPPAQAPTVAAGDGTRETREKMTTRRKRIAEHLLEAQHATAHLTTFNEIDMTAVIALRERLKERVEKEYGVKLSFMPFFVKAACLALKSYPAINAQIDGDSIVYKHYVNMGIAVAAEGGLVVPNIRDADRKGMIVVAREIVEVATRARDGRLTMDDLTGGTFTITNGGVFGSLVSTPILNYPQVGILGLHKTQERPVAVNGKVEVRPMMYVALSYDHRLVEGQHAVQFLVRVKELMEDPASMLVE